MSTKQFLQFKIEFYMIKRLGEDKHFQTQMSTTIQHKITKGEFDMKTTLHTTTHQHPPGIAM